MVDILNMNAGNTMTNVDTSVHLLRHKQANTSAYFVIVKCVVGESDGHPDERMLLVRMKNEDPTSGGITLEEASDRQMAVGQLLVQHLIARKSLTATFKPTDTHTELLIDVPDTEYYLRPITLANKHMTTIKFYNEHHAAAYAGEIIDTLLHYETDWTKMSIKDKVLTVVCRRRM